MKLYKHQEEALERTKTFNKCAYYHDMGLGKTFTGSEKLMSFGNIVNLVVCQKSKIKDWLNHFNEHYAKHERDLCCKGTIFDLTDKKQFDVFLSECKSATEHNIITEDLTGESYIGDSLYPFCIVGVINYDLIFRRPELLNLRDFSLLLDESSLIQNYKSKRTKTILKMKPSNVILLSGTPVGGKYENLYTQLKLLGWNITKTAFWNTFINFELVQYGRLAPKIPKIIGYKNVDLLKQKLRECGADFLTTDEVFDLPLQNFITINIKCNKEYKDFLRYKYLKLENLEFIGDNPLKSLLYSRLLISAYNEYKLNALIDLCDSTEDRLIIFYNFKEELNQIIDSVKNRPISIVNGQVKDLNAYEQENNSLTLIQYQAGAMGLNLQKANKIIYYSLPLSSELYEQSKKRIHRIGQNRPCFYYLLLAENSIEERIKTTLDKRNDYTQELFNEDF